MRHDSALPSRINWTCQTCNTPVITGMIHASFSGIRQAQAAHAEYKKAKSTNGEDFHALVSVAAYPRIVHWRVVCDGCRSEQGHDCSDCYGIDLERCQSVFALFKWTRHLYGKTWFEVTDWIYFASGVAEANGPVYEATGVH